LNEPVLGQSCGGTLSGRGCIEENVDIVGIGEGVERGGKDLVLQPKAGKDQYGSIFSSQRPCECSTLSGKGVLARDELAM
jgi:hypothetical protein